VAELLGATPISASPSSARPALQDRRPAQNVGRGHAQPRTGGPGGDEVAKGAGISTPAARASTTSQRARGRLGRRRLILMASANRGRRCWDAGLPRKTPLLHRLFFPPKTPRAVPRSALRRALPLQAPAHRDRVHALHQREALDDLARQERFAGRKSRILLDRNAYERFSRPAGSTAFGGVGPSHDGTGICKTRTLSSRAKGERGTFARDQSSSTVSGVDSFWGPP